MLQQTRNSECHFCLILSLSQLHKQFMSPISLVQLNWYCESGGDNVKTLTWGRDFINLFFHKDVYRRSIFFVLARSPIFSKRTKEKDKTTFVYTVRVKQGMACGMACGMT